MIHFHLISLSVSWFLIKTLLFLVIPENVSGQLVTMEANTPEKEQTYVSSNAIQFKLNEHDTLQIRGHHVHPVINPVNPDLISYEHQNQIIIVNGSSRATEITRIYCLADTGEILFPDLVDSDLEESDLGRCSQLSWRPVIDYRGNYWFAFISEDENKINVGFINDRLRCNGFLPCKWFPLSFSSEQELRHPKWSPDGSVLMFNKGSEIRFFFDMHDLIAKNKPDGFTLWDEPLGLGYFPEWNPNGRFIAFESADDNHPNDIIIADYFSFTDGNPNKFLLSEIERTAVPVSNRYKPSWSPDGKFLSYLTNLENPDEDYQNWAVRVVEVDYDRQNNLHAVSAHSGSNYLKQNVYRTDFRTGLPMINLLYRGPENLESYIMSIEKNPALHYPIRINSTTGGQEPSNIQLPTRVNNNFLAAHAYDNKIRLAYSSQRFGSLQLNVDDVALPRIYRTSHHYVPYEKSPRKALLLSAVFPGLGQFFKEENEKAVGYVLTGSILALHSLGKIADTGITKTTLRDPAFLIPAMLFGALYAHNILDVLDGFPIVVNTSPVLGNTNLDRFSNLPSRNTQSGFTPSVTLRLSY